MVVVIVSVLYLFVQIFFIISDHQLQLNGGHYCMCTIFVCSDFFYHLWLRIGPMPLFVVCRPLSYIHLFALISSCPSLDPLKDGA